MRHKDLSELVPACCRVGVASIDLYDDNEKDKVRTFLPDVATMVVIAHHVTHSLEWVWFEFPGDPAGETCPADLHAKAVAEEIGRLLDRNGHAAVMLPYPGECGLMFKTLATKTALGQLGDNYLFMNGDWGPWIHLRVVLTNASIAAEAPVPQEACTHCGKCIEACPAGAILPDDFDGLRCRSKMREIRTGLGNIPYLFECERCLRACPVGAGPPEVVVSYRGPAS